MYEDPVPSVSHAETSKILKQNLPPLPFVQSSSLKRILSQRMPREKGVRSGQPDQIHSIYIRYDNFRYRHNDQSGLYTSQSFIYRNKNYFFFNIRQRNNIIPKWHNSTLALKNVMSNILCNL